MDELTRLRPDLVIDTGDLSVNGADDEADLAFALEEHARLPRPWRVLPGNHDIGEEPGNLHLGQPIDQQRLDGYRRLAGADRWSVDVADWRLVGISSQLCGSGLPAEEEQLAWLGAQILEADRPMGLFLHKPLFLQAPDNPTTRQPDDPTPDTACLLPEPRQRLLHLLEGSAVRFVACGNVHHARIAEWRGLTMVWAPSTAFPATDVRPGANDELGWVVHRFQGEHEEFVLVRDDELERHDLTAIKGHGRYQFLYQTPPAPLPRRPTVPSNGAPTRA